MIYDGKEKIVINGQYSDYSMIDFWRWAYSNIRHNMQRGNFADFLVRCALVDGGINTRQEIGTGLEPYDLEGPMIRHRDGSTSQSRIEVKSAGAYQTWGRRTQRVSFSIAPAMMPIEGDYKDGSPRQRNNDLYVFSYYTAFEESANILDMYWWKFYVVPTYMIENDAHLHSQKTISLASVETLSEPTSFEHLCDAIVRACTAISENT